MDEADQCHRLGFMHHGRLIGLGPPAQLKNDLGMDTMEDVFIAFAEQGEGAIREP
jgi:ABC-type multidrug transport system ATPase subunit